MKRNRTYEIDFIAFLRLRYANRSYAGLVQARLFTTHAFQAKCTMLKAVCITITTGITTLKQGVIRNPTPLAWREGLILMGMWRGNPVNWVDPTGLEWIFGQRMSNSPVVPNGGEGVYNNNGFNNPIWTATKAAEAAVCAFPPLRGASVAATNLLPKTLARVIPGNITPKTLGTTPDVFVTDAKILEGLNSKQIAEKLAIPESSSGFKVIEFPTPNSGVASPVFRDNPGFIGGGSTAGGAPEFVIPNGPIPVGANTRYVP